jgi:hypothetical protein
MADTAEAAEKALPGTHHQKSQLIFAYLREEKPPVSRSRIIWLV